MGNLSLVLLPGLDGTGDLFRPLLNVLPTGIDGRVVSYPTDRVLTYDELLPVVLSQLPADGPVVLLGESFSGPLALRAAARRPDGVRAVVLCASFIRRPVPAWARYVAWPLMFRLPPPDVALRLLLVGWGSPAALVGAVRAAIRRVRPDVLAGRVRQVLDVDAADALAASPAPVLYLRAGRDALVGAASVRAIAAARPDVVVRTVPAPHLLLQAAPAAAWDAIRDFLASLGGAGEAD